MAYNYFRKIELTEHCLRSEEIAGIFGIFSSSGKPHSTLVSALLKANNIEPYYYQSSKGLLKGYLLKDYYDLLCKFKKESNSKDCITIASKKYNYSLDNKTDRLIFNKKALINKLNNIYISEKVIDF